MTPFKATKFQDHIGKHDPYDSLAIVPRRVSFGQVNQEEAEETQLGLRMLSLTRPSFGKINDTSVELETRKMI